jgi:2-methylcitrate dehydratase PrpD
MAQSELEAKFCPAFMVSAIALRGKAGIHEFTDEFVRSESVQRMMEKVQTILDPEIEALGFEKIRSTVEVDLDDGRTLVQKADERYRGGPERPFRRNDVYEKFNECAALILPDAAIGEVFRKVESLEDLKDINQLVGILTP